MSSIPILTHFHPEPAMSPPLLRLALPTPLRRLFDYLPPQEVDLSSLQPGVRVQVPFQARQLVGILIEVVKSTTIASAKLKQARAILDQTPLLAPDVYALCKWAADYYHDALGEVLAFALPPMLRKGHALIDETVDEIEDKAKSTFTFSQAMIAPFPHTLNDAQQKASATISENQSKFEVIVLDGITGSGKTEVYIHAIAQQLLLQRQVLILVPEISLTPQMVAHFQARFHIPIAILHSNLSAKARLKTWQQVRSGAARLLIGTRSAIFATFSNLGLIIVDEEHDPSFKQQDHFRYHARDLAIMRAKINHIPVVLGSATPSLETLANITRKRYQHVVLPTRAGAAKLPEYQIIPMQQATTQSGISQILLDEIATHLERDNQVLLFLNRRGFAPVLYCCDCAHTFVCHRCDARLVYHHTPPRLHCHYCDFKMMVPHQCVRCNGHTLQPIGLGTQRIEQCLQNHFQTTPLIRIDRDNTKQKGTLQTLLTAINENKRAILLGTQMLAKGHHFPKVTLVGILDADAGLFSADFRASEQMGQLLVQVAGRAGRVAERGKVLIQTRYPSHPALNILLNDGYTVFAHQLLAERKTALLPPHHFMAILRAESAQEHLLAQFLKKIKSSFSHPPTGLTLMGPLPALIAKRRGLYCQQLVFKAAKRPDLQSSLKSITALIEDTIKPRKIKWVLDVDPVEM